jgi:hypothetical protein
MARTSFRANGCSKGRVFARCGCRDETGRQLGASCPLLGSTGHGSWTFEVRVSAPAGRRRVRRGGHDSAAHAHRALAVYRRRDAQCAVAGSWSAGAWLTDWLSTHRAIRASTRRSYAGHLSLYFLPILGRISLDELGIDDVQTMIDTIIDAHARAGHPIEPGTLVRIRATLRAGLNAAMRRGLISTNPAAQVELPPHPRCYPVIWTPERVAAWTATGERPTIGVWTAEQLHTFLLHTAQDQWGLLWRVVGFRGLRRGEACRAALERRRPRRRPVRRGAATHRTQRWPSGHRTQERRQPADVGHRRGHGETPAPAPRGARGQRRCLRARVRRCCRACASPQPRHPPVRGGSASLRAAAGEASRPASRGGHPGAGGRGGSEDGPGDARALHDRHHR